MEVNFPGVPAGKSIRLKNVIIVDKILTQQVPARENRESGLRPERSRHCYRERAAHDATGYPTGRLRQVMIVSQETCLLCKIPSVKGAPDG